jgi:hypothetical protein
MEDGRPKTEVVGIAKWEVDSICVCTVGPDSYRGDGILNGELDTGYWIV